MDRHNFFEKTKALWELVDEKPNKEPDFVSESRSAYWYTKEGVYRHADHWGQVNGCIWMLHKNGAYISREATGFCNWDLFLQQSRLNYAIEDNHIIKLIPKIYYNELVSVELVSALFHGVSYFKDDFYEFESFVCVDHDMNDDSIVLKSSKFEIELKFKNDYGYNKFIINLENSIKFREIFSITANNYVCGKYMDHWAIVSILTEIGYVQLKVELKGHGDYGHFSMDFKKLDN